MARKLKIAKGSLLSGFLLKFDETHKWFWAQFGFLLVARTAMVAFGLTDPNESFGIGNIFQTTFYSLFLQGFPELATAKLANAFDKKYPDKKRGILFSVV